MAVENNYQDISVDFIRGGSEQEPLLIQPGEEQKVELAVFAQNAESDVYNLPVQAFICGQENADAQNIVTLYCGSTSLDVSCLRTATDESTLTHTYVLKNLGERLTDVSVSVSGDAQKYTRIDPIISNLAMDANSSVTFKAVPDLAKMKENNLSAVSGKIVVSSGGKSQEFDLVFDTQGQDITLTTFEHLLYLQYENPYCNLTPVDDSMKADMSIRGTQIIGESSLSYTYGENEDKNLSLAFQFSGDGYDGENKFDPQVEITDIHENGYIIHVKMLLSREDYSDILDNSLATFAVSRGINVQSKEDYLGNYANFVFDYQLAVTDHTISNNPEEGILPDSVGKTLAFLSIASDMVDGWQVMSDPNFSTQHKVMYGALTLGTIVLSLAGVALPGIGPAIIFGVTAFGLNSMKTLLQDNPLTPAIYYDIQGSQCTNRGLVSTDFYLPNYTADKKKTSMYTTGRMHGGDYVDRSDTNYKYILNGEEVSTSSNNGLTDVAIAKLPTDPLKFGDVNTLVRDYDTNPGSHQVTTDNEIVILYPSDTEIGYIGTPEELQDIRIKPDFAVYSENIFCEETPIVGDQTKIKFNVYNRGSSGGWVTIQVTDETGTIFTKKNHYMDAFTGDSFEFDWIPSRVSSNIQVTLTNTSVDLEERKDDNNLAKRTIKARQREIPQIIDLNASISDYGKNVTLFTNISDYSDVVKISFYIDNQAYSGSIHSGTVGETKRFWTESIALEPGDHTIKLVVTYATGKTSTSDFEQHKVIRVEAKRYQIPEIKEIQPKEFLFGTETPLSVDITNSTDVKSVEFLVNDSQRYTALTNDLGASRSYSSTVRFNTSGTQTVQILVTYFIDESSTATIEKEATVSVKSFEESVFSFSLSDDFSEPEFELTDGVANVQEQENGNYFLCLTPDMYLNPENYHLFITTDNGFLFTDLTNRDINFSAEDCRKLQFTGSDDFEIYELRLVSVNDMIVEKMLNYSDFLQLLPGKYEFDISYSCYGVYTNSRCQIVISDQDVMVDLSDNLRQYNYAFANDIEIEYASAELYYRNPDVEYWTGTSLSTMFDYEKRTLSCVINDIYALESIERASEALIIVYTQDSIFINRIKPETRVSFDTVLLSRNDLKKLTVNTDQTQNVQIQSLAINNDLFNITLNSDVVYLPQGEYEISAECRYNDNQSLYKRFSVSMDRDQTKTIEVEVSSLTVDWPNVFEKQGYIYGNGTNSQHFYASNYDKNSIVILENGDYTVYTTLYRGNSNYEISSKLNATGNENHINIGQAFSGEVSFYNSTYYGKESAYFYLENLFDINQNQLSYFWSQEELYNLNGYIEFTNTENHKENYKVPLSLDSLYFSVELPNVEGTFDVTVFISTSDEPFAPVDKTDLEQVISMAQNIANENYTEESWGLFSEALQNAKDTINNPEATQEEIDLALYNLEMAIQHLTKQEESSETAGSTENSTEDITTSRSTIPPTQVSTVPEETTNRTDQTTINSSQGSTVPSTEKPTQAPTAKPAEKPTVKPTEKVTNATTEKPTSAPTTAENAENPGTGESMTIVAACSVLAVAAGAAVVLTRKKKGE